MSNEVTTPAQERVKAYARIPNELKGYRQWVTWAYENEDGEKKPTKVLYNPFYNGHAAVDKPDTWISFDDAVSAVANSPERWAGIGFVLTENDPFAFIDLDSTKHLPNHDELLERQQHVYGTFDSYAEWSPSGAGLHIITKGSVERGRKRHQIEVYSNLRYMTMTGNVFHDAPIIDEDIKLKALWHQMGGAASGNERTPTYQLQTTEDAVILERMFAGPGGEKRRDLVEGRWQRHFATWSEADQALFNNLVFYTKNKEQILRMFHASQLANRKKAHRVDYLERTLSLAFDRELPPVNIDPILAELAKMMDAAKMPTIDDADLPPIIDIRDFAKTPPRPRGWIVDGLIPERTVTMKGGDGGIGKSLAATQAGFAVATGTKWFRTETRAGSCLFITAEDEADDLHWRLAMIAKHEGVNLGDVEPERMGIWSFAGHDALLVVGNGRGGVVPTPLFGAIRARIAAMRPTLTVLDTSADLFGGEENNRTHVRQFIGMLRAIAIEFDTAILLLSHPSLTGMANGSGLSGSTAWNNSVRARLYMERDPNDPATTILTVKKSNYGPSGEQIRLEWRNGVFAALGRDKSADAHKIDQEQSVDDVFLELVAEFNGREHRLAPSHNSPTNYAPKLFSKHHKSGGFSVKQFADAMVRLFARNAIEIEKVGRWKDKMKDNIVVVPPSDSPSGSISE